MENTLDHIDLSIKNNLVDIERAGKISGSRFYFLKNQLVKSEKSEILNLYSLTHYDNLRRSVAVKFVNE